jgi:hypothetical protein
MRCFGCRKKQLVEGGECFSEVVPGSVECGVYGWVGVDYS